MKILDKKDKSNKIVEDYNKAIKGLDDNSKKNKRMFKIDLILTPNERD